MTTEPKPAEPVPAGSGGGEPENGAPSGGPSGPAGTGGLGTDTLKSIEKDIEALEQHDVTEDAGATEGTRTDMRVFWRWTVFLAALTLAVFHLWTGYAWTGVTNVLPPLQQRSFHLALALGLIFLLYPVRPQREAKARGPLYGGVMAACGLFFAYMGAGAVGAGAYLFLPIAAFVGPLAVLVAAVAVLAVRAARGGVADPSPVRRGAGWTLLVGSALVTLDLATDNTYGAFFFLPWVSGLVAAVAAVAALLFLRYPERLPAALWEWLRRWALLVAGGATLAVLALTGEAGWPVLGSALLVLAVAQAARFLPVRVLGLAAGDVVLALMGLFAGFYMFVEYEDIARTPGGAADPTHVAVGTIGILLVLVAAHRVLGGALVVLASAMLAYSYIGPSMPGFLRHGGFSVEATVNNLYVGTTGVFGIPLGISATFIFLFMIFAALLQRTGMERFFTDLALGSTGWATGGTAKVGVATSAFSGTITGSSVANTVSNGAFTIPMMKKSGYSKEYSGAVEASSSTGGQIAPPIMGAGAFIMIEMTPSEVDYQAILQAAIVPAILFFLSQFVVIHYDSKKLGIGGLPRHMLPRVGRLMATRGYLLAPLAAIFVLLSMGYSPMPAAMGAVATTVVVNLVAQLLTAPWERRDGRIVTRPLGDVLFRAARMSVPIVLAAGAAVGVVWVIQLLATNLNRGMRALLIAVLVALAAYAIAALFNRWKRSEPDQLNLHSLLDGLVGAARLALPIIAACAAAGLISGVITTTDLGLKLSSGLLGIADSVSGGVLAAVTAVAGPAVGEAFVAGTQLNLVLILFMSMIACLILGIGLPTTANYVVTATLAAPAIIVMLRGDLEQETVAMVLMAHMFVYYFGVMADITPPVCLAAYAASGISGGEPVRTGVQAVRIAVAGFVTPFMFVFSPELLLQGVTWLTGTLAATTAALGASFVGVAVVGYINRQIDLFQRLLLAVGGLMLLNYGWLSDLLGVLVGVVIFGLQYVLPGPTHRVSAAATTSKGSS